ncbi:hypothetical protein BWZ22_07220 [Seonamhaeicola sp. S2-3]|uniref:hypothetical protein n=1 Tax=Seonamhaeicola sp. S2-3 TaxID=1936081 RepID=UPI000972D372|nr:hypothetical protein [Seonamhaeicola sp. S2-3]APY11044.1 hypothetical protein BWZ22_07220 [Seonamhaeicola sp. S2-3]
MRIFFLSILLLVGNLIFSQIKIVDSQTKQPIAFVDIYSEKGDVVGQTNFNGEVDKAQLNRIINLNVGSLHFYHKNYEAKRISLNDFLKLKELLLKGIDREFTKLDEVVIKSKRKKYIKYTAYFRSIQFNNNQPQFFMDGIVEYTVPVKSFKPKINIKANRSLLDKKIKQIDEKGAVHLGFNLAGVADIKDFINYKNLEKKYILKQSKEFVAIHTDSFKIGEIRTDHGMLSLEMQVYSPSNPKTMKFFGTESVLTNYSVNASYEEGFVANQLENLRYFKESRAYNIKQKKDLEYKHINVINEVFILKKENTNEKGKSNANYYGFIEKSNYESKFWKTLDEKVSPLPGPVKQFVSNKMVE